MAASTFGPDKLLLRARLPRKNYCAFSLHLQYCVRFGDRRVVGRAIFSLKEASQMAVKKRARKKVVKRRTTKRKAAKKRTTKRKAPKRKTAKRKTAKRKTAKRKTAKRKTAKRKTAKRAKRR